MSVPEHVIRYWQAQDALLDLCEPTWWGAVVTDRRFPHVWDANHARIDRDAPGLTMNEIADVLVPALRAARAETFHVVSFAADTSTQLIDELVGSGHSVSWDLVMDLDVEQVLPADPSIRVEPLFPGDELWDTLRATFPLFGEDVAGAGKDLLRMESTVMSAGGKRWLGVRDGDHAILSIVAVQSLDGVGYIDNVATFPGARGLGLASELTLAACRAVLDEDARHVWLMADPDQDAVRRMYRRLGFRDAGRLASTKGPMP